VEEGKGREGREGVRRGGKEQGEVERGGRVLDEEIGYRKGKDGFCLSWGRRVPSYATVRELNAAYSCQFCCIDWRWVGFSVTYIFVEQVLSNVAVCDIG